MRRHLLLAAVLALGGCATTASSTYDAGVRIDGVTVICDPGPVWPLAPTCRAALTAALAASGFAPADIAYAQYRYGSYCAPGAPCASAPPNFGYVVFWTNDPPVLVQLSADPEGHVTVLYKQAPFSSAVPATVP